MARDPQCSPAWTDSYRQTRLGITCLSSEEGFLIDLIVPKDVFDSTVTQVHIIEFQKRGLLHMHLLIWLQRKYQFTTPAEVNAIISAEFPDPQTHPRLFRLVSDVITHGPCREYMPDASCMQNRRCGKHYPKELCDETIVHNDGYSKYRRQNTGVQIGRAHV